ncbi:exosome-associated family protein [Sodiomyces alkalinus F11]|uniref:Exosome complex protein n=1 Tax=Sodiomyces alkalinus (strain CBS 110278 / VKM F-3762 / F11) TaxID=1314773 RepID=A0A3N2PT63_SODAK|nr:exosome-associated family protein [Sodiomyces alkalinus F11]ROT37671.1 exosome-associated family protein [Sodiomyces alkalinus F11]
MDVKDLAPGLDQLGSNLDDLEETLQPLIDNLADMSTELPLLDRAKLMTLTAYSIESLLFSAMRLQGVDAVNHEVMTELKRVKQYFAKIQKAEEPPSQRSTTVNTEATTRILKADLSDNKELKQKLEEKLAEERAKALLKSIQNKRSAPGDSPSTNLSSRPKNKSRKT